MVWFICVISTVILYYTSNISTLQAFVMLVALHFYANIVDEIRRNK